MTDILKYIDVNPDDAKQRAQRMHVKKDEIQLIRKGYEVKVDEFDNEERTITARVSTADQDRDGEIVSPKGIDLKDYSRNPVLGWCHDYKHPAIGKALWSKIDKDGLICKFQFAPTQFAGDIYTLYAGGYMRAFSIGFIPMEYDQKTKTHEKISLLEVSAVLVPANQNALVMEAYAKGLIKSPALKKALEIEIEGEEAEAESIVVDEPIRIDAAELEANLEAAEKPEAEALAVEPEKAIEPEAVPQPEDITVDTDPDKAQDAPNVKEPIAELHAKIDALSAQLEAFLKAHEAKATSPVEDVLSAIKCGSCDIPLSEIHAEPADEKTMTPEQVRQAVDAAFSKLDLKAVMNKSVRDNLDRMRGRIR